MAVSKSVHNKILLITISLLLLFQTATIPNTFGLFNARVLTEEEKNIAEREYLSVINKCNERLQSRIDSGPVCDAFMDYYIQQCDRLDDLITYCGISDENIGINQMLIYQAARTIQQGCLINDKAISENVICEEHVATLGTIADGYNRILKTHSHLQAQSSVYTPIGSNIIGEVVNNYSFPVDSIQILVTTFDDEGKVMETKRVNAQDTYLRPSQPSGFSVSLDSMMSNNSNYTTTSIFKKSSIDKPPLLKLNVTTVSMNPVYIRGIVTNLGNQSTDDVEVSGIFYDANHTVIDVAKGDVNNSTALRPNEKAAFIVQPDINFREREKISSYTASVQSPDYAMAPP